MVNSSSLFKLYCEGWKVVPERFIQSINLYYVKFTVFDCLSEHHQKSEKPQPRHNWF